MESNPHDTASADFRPLILMLFILQERVRLPGRTGSHHERQAPQDCSFETAISPSRRCLAAKDSGIGAARSSLGVPRAFSGYGLEGFVQAEVEPRSEEYSLK